VDNIYNNSRNMYLGIYSGVAFLARKCRDVLIIPGRTEEDNRDLK
jgi:hypothetical protein